MSYQSETPFDSIEGAQEYLKLLAQTVVEAQHAVQADLHAGGEAKQHEALRLVFYNLEKLSHHVKAGSRILNDLRTLRRLLQQERRSKPHTLPVRTQARKREVPVLNREAL